MINELNKRQTVTERNHIVYLYNMISPNNKELYDLITYFYDYYENRENNKWLVVFVNDEKKAFDVEQFENDEELLKKYKTFKMFTKNERSSFSYWFAHWCSFQLCALNLGIWKIKYLFHDFEKPWMKLFMSYKKIQKWHRNHNSHHLEYGLIHGFDKIDWETLIIDWECSHLSKQQCPLDCREELENKLSDEKWKPYEKTIRDHIEPLLNKYFL